MKRIFVLAMTVLVFAAFNTTHAQLRKIPAEVTEAFKEKYPHTKNAEWKDKLTAFQVSYEMDGDRYESKFSSKGEWLQTEKEIEQDALPAGVKDGFSKSKFTGWEVKSVTWVEDKDNNVQYRLFVKKSGVEKKYLYFDKEGKLVKDVITI
jgi:hypothetical protein